MEDDAIKRFMREVRSSGLFRELKRREYFISKPELRKLKDRRSLILKKKAEVRRARVMPRHRFYDEKK